MYDESDGELLETHFGTSSPYWRLGIDSNALELAAVRGLPNISVALNATDASRIRSLTGVTSAFIMEVKLFGEPVRLHLVGKKHDQTTWAGTASAYSDTISVARDLTQGLAFAEQVVSEVNSLVVVLNRNGIFQRFNRVCEEVLGKREEDVIGKSAFELFMSEEQGAQSSANITGFFENGKPFSVERYINTVNGPRLYQFRNKFVQSGSGQDEQFLICSGVDITEERKAQKRLSELANTDVLTGLPNRHAITSMIGEALAACADDAQRRVGILFLDLDNFKRVNDHYGHGIGDRLLTEASAIVTRCLPEGATLARLGGDEFLVLFQDTTLNLLERTAQKIIAQFGVSVCLDIMEVYTSCSIGIALYPEHGDTLETLIRNADTAMYAAKDAGKDTFRVFTTEMNEKVAKAMWLDTNLRKAIEENQFVLHYQPLIDLDTGEVQSVEALIRWQMPGRGLIEPSEFIPHAEDSGLIGPIGRWVMGEAARQAKIWQDMGLNLRVSINMSARQLSDVNVANHFSDICTRAKLTPCLLDIELTESCLISDEKRVQKLMQQFREFGAKIYLDDFGTGYSSLGQLSRLPFDVIKLDRSFVQGVGVDGTSQALVSSMVTLARALGFSIVAEGIETPEQEAFLSRVDVKRAQGYIYARPMAAQGLEAWILERRKLRRIA